MCPQTCDQSIVCFLKNAARTQERERCNLAKLIVTVEFCYLQGVRQSKDWSRLLRCRLGKPGQSVSIGLALPKGSSKLWLRMNNNRHQSRQSQLGLRRLRWLGTREPYPPGRQSRARRTPQRPCQLFDVHRKVAFLKTLWQIPVVDGGGHSLTAVKPTTRMLTPVAL